MSAGVVVTVREVLTLLAPRQARLVAGEQGLGRGVSWASTMRARPPAFEGFQGGELALLSLVTLRSLRAHVERLTLPVVVDQLAEVGAAAIAVTGLDDTSAQTADDRRALPAAQARADEHGIPLITLPTGVVPAVIEREVIAHVVARREQATFVASTAPPNVRAAAQLRASLRAEALDALLSGTYVGEPQMRTRAAQFGHDLAEPHAILWLELYPASDDAAGHPANHASPSPPHNAREDAHAQTLGEELEVALGAWVRVRSGQVVALLPLAVGQGTGELVTRVARLMERALPPSSEAAVWSAGLGEVATAPFEVRRSAGEARDAERLGRMLLGPCHIARTADLGVYRLLLALRDAGELEPFVTRTLAPLRVDHRAADVLVETLEAFFASNGNLSEAARSLHLHRNSLLYRLSRARDLLSQDLDDAEVRLALQLAIKGQRILDLA